MRISSLAAALAFAACTPAPAPAPKGETANGCPATATAPWSATVDTVFSVEASASGRDCATATATITVRDAAGVVVHGELYPANQVMTLAGAESVQDMERRLAEWISPAGAAADSTGDLPDWKPGQDSPMSDEFPFYPEEGTDRSAYAELLASDLPMFCYVQGMESLACFAFEDDALRKIGVQTFPG